MEHGRGGVDLLDRARRGGGEVRRAVVVGDVEQNAAIGLGDERAGMVLQRLLAHVRAGAGRPGDVQQVGRLERGIIGGRDHHYPAGHGVRRIVEHQIAQIAFDLLGRGVVDRHDLRSVARRRQLGAGIDHPRQLGVDAVDRGAVGLGVDVEAMRLAPDQAALLDRLDRQRLELVGGELPRDGAALGDVAIGHRTPAGMDRAAFSRAVRGVGAHQLGAGFDQRDPTGGARLAEHREGLPHRPAAAGDHQAPFRIAVDMDDAHLVPIRFELVGEDARERGADVLAHLGADDVDGDDTGRVDPEPDRRFELRPGGGGGYAARHRRIDRRQHAREAERDPRRAARHEEATPAERRSRFGACDEAAHALVPISAAACLIAARMRT